MGEVVAKTGAINLGWRLELLEELLIKILIPWLHPDQCSQNVWV